MDFAQFIAPLSIEEFRRDYYQRQPLHLKSAADHGDRRSQVLDWDRLTALLAVPSHWSESNLKLLLNSRPVIGDHYLSEIRTHEGPQLRGDPAKIQMLMGMGASIVANRLEDISLDVRQVTAMLGRELSAHVGANAYASFQGIRAFNTHCDLHEVFAIQLQGEKSWQIYANRAQAPVQSLQGPDAQSIIDQVKGPVMMRADMEPGDLLYIPRGFYHDALASSESSLHLTFAVAPLDGRILFRMLEEMAIRDPEFREHLPDHRDDKALATALEHLAEKLQTLTRSALVRDEVIARQRALAHDADQINPANRTELDQWVRTTVAAEVAWPESGAVLLHANGQERLGVLAQAAEWALCQASFSTLQLKSRFRWLDGDEIHRLLTILRSANLFAR
jgi:lysine-specific demethylase/histidyl-hydroxylase NO66